MEKDRVVRGSKDKQVSWLSSRTPGLDWPGHSLPGKIKIGTEMMRGSILFLFALPHLAAIDHNVVFLAS
jgi:hypothetical protein